MPKIGEIFLGLICISRPMCAEPRLLWPHKSHVSLISSTTLTPFLELLKGNHRHVDHNIMEDEATKWLRTFRDRRGHCLSAVVAARTI